MVIVSFDQQTSQTVSFYNKQQMVMSSSTSTMKLRQNSFSLPREVCLEIQIKVLLMKKTSTLKFILQTKRMQKVRNIISREKNRKMGME